jgi:hypothetical protein
MMRSNSCATAQPSSSSSHEQLLTTVSSASAPTVHLPIPISPSIKLQQAASTTCNLLDPQQDAVLVSRARIRSPREAGHAARTAEVLVALRKQVQAGRHVTLPARVEEQARRFRVRPEKEPLAASWTRCRCSSGGAARSAITLASARGGEAAACLARVSRAADRTMRACRVSRAATVPD